MDSENNTTPNEDKDLRRDALAVLCAQMQAHERYHTQKENMTWLATAAYVGAAALLVGRDPFWKDWPIQSFGAWLVLLLITAISVISFVCWQFFHRNRASAFFTCCNDVAAQFLHSCPTKEELRPVSLCELDKMLVPRAVEKRFREIFQGEFNWPQRLMLTLIVLWTIGAGTYVILTYRSLCGS